MNADTIDFGATRGGAEATLLANRYRIVRQLGQGGMGLVWLAEDTQLDNRPVAVKMLPSILVSNKRAYQQLKSEALVSLKLTHTNIAAVRAFEENNGNPFLVVDYIDGVTLDDYLSEHSVATATNVATATPPSHPGGLPESEVIRLLAPIAAALDYAHTKGVIHRDVKPGNVMIAKDGTPYILDFGIAREVQETLTRVTGKLSSGTLQYMSPEQLHGAAPTPAQDVYSFAAMAYECLMGEPPFTRGQIEYQIDHDMPPSLGPHIAICGQGVMAGLAKNADARPASCAAVLKTTGTHGTAPEGRAGSTNLPHDGGTARVSRGRRRGPVVAAIVAGVALLGAGLYFMSAENKKRLMSVENEKQLLSAEKAELQSLSDARTEYDMAFASLKKQLSALDWISRKDGFGSRIDAIRSRIPSQPTQRDTT